MTATERPTTGRLQSPGRDTWYRGKRFGATFRTIATYVGLAVVSTIILIPLFWMMSTSLKKQMDVYIFPPVWIPRPPQWQNYLTVLTTFDFPLYALNTAFITSTVIVGTLLSSSMAGYGFARLRAPGKNLIFMLLLATMMLPYTVVMIPVFVLFKNLKWLDSFKPLIAPAFFGNVFYIFLLRQFFLTVSPDLEDAARIDGCSARQTYTRIMLPLARPALITVAIFAFVESWNDFMGPLIYLSSESKRTIALSLAFYQGSTRVGPQLHLLMAASFLAVLPCILVFYFAQRYFVQGIVFTGVKG
ncbi:MAG: carbohydrate ABC transporter permease [Anaerolineae bacterium]